MKKTQSKVKAPTVTVTREQHRKQRAVGLKADEVLSPGKHRFTRGSFTALHPAEKVGVYIKLDPDVLEFFKSMAQTAGAAPYQTQINAELRKVMEASTASSGPVASLREAQTLIKNAVRQMESA